MSGFLSARRVPRLTRGSVSIDGRNIDLRPPLPRITVAQAFERFANVAEDEMLRLANEDEDAFFEKLAFVESHGLARGMEPAGESA